MAGKRKRTSAPKTKSKTKSKRARTTKKRSSKKKTQVKKRYSHYDRVNRPLTGSKARVSRKARLPKKAQPRPTQSVSKSPMDVAHSMAIEKKKEYALTEYKPDSKAPEKRAKKRHQAFKKAIQKTKEAGKYVEFVIDESAKAADAVGSWAEKHAAGANALAIATENPYIAAGAGVIDAAAGLHHAWHKEHVKEIVKRSQEGMQKGDPNRAGYKQLTDSRKYQKLMADVADEDYPMTNMPLVPWRPEEIDLPPPDETGL